MKNLIGKFLPFFFLAPAFAWAVCDPTLTQSQYITCESLEVQRATGRYPHASEFSVPAIPASAQPIYTPAVPTNNFNFASQTPVVQPIKAAQMTTYSSGNEATSIGLYGSPTTTRVAQIDPSIALKFQPVQIQSPFEMMQQMERLKSMRLQNEQMEAQQREQTRLRELDNQRQTEQRSQELAERQRLAAQKTAEELSLRDANEKIAEKPKQPDPFMVEWLKAAAPRMGLFSDFDSVVFAPDVAINVDMIRLMTPSTFAADIAYYLGTHKTEALAISNMNLPDAAKAITRIETRLKPNKLPLGVAEANKAKSR